MIDEDTGEEPTCPYCGSAEDCPHLLAVLDKTFSTCDGGYCYERFEELTGTVEEAFKDVLRQRGRRRKKQWNDYYLQDLWEKLLAEGIPDDVEDGLVLPARALIELIVDVLEVAGGDRCGGSLVSESGAFCSSAIELLYAEEPEKVFSEAVSMLERRLADTVEGSREKQQTASDGR